MWSVEKERREEGKIAEDEGRGEENDCYRSDIFAIIIRIDEEDKDVAGDRSGDETVIAVKVGGYPGA